MQRVEQRGAIEFAPVPKIRPICKSGLHDLESLLLGRYHRTPGETYNRKKTPLGENHPLFRTEQKRQNFLLMSPKPALPTGLPVIVAIFRYLNNDRAELAVSLLELIK